MRYIDNIEIKGFSASPNIMNIGANKQFEKQRNEFIEYDEFLRKLAELLEAEGSEELKHIYNTLIYKGNVFDITRDVMPHINSLCNEGLTPKQTFEELKTEKRKLFAKSLHYNK